MRVGGGHSKGSEFERKIAKEIVKAFKRFGITQRDCWRSTMSGGHERAAGDLELSQKLERLFPFCLEMKHRKKIRWENFLLSKDSEEKRWIKQAVDGANKRKNMAPALVIRGNNQPIFVLLGGRAFDDYAAYIHIEGSGRDWQLLFWKKFLKVAVILAKEERR